MGNSLKICLDARMVDGAFGGVQQVVIGLASGFSKLQDGDEQYHFLVYSDAHEWLLPYLGESCKVLIGPPAPPRPRKHWRRRLPFAATLRNAYDRVAPSPPSANLAPPRTDGTIERAGIDLMHFTVQGGFLTEIPSIYQPHDLQHVHLPQYFTKKQRALREYRYRELCHQARLVVAMSRWGRQDLINHFGLPEDKVTAIPWAPVLEAYPTPTEQDLARVREKFDLPPAFAFFPSKTYPHKNHLRLLEALALLRDRDDRLIVPLVCSGALSSFYPQIARRVRALRLADQVRFIGFVDPLELQCLYHLSRCMVFPTEFEGWGLPLLEAFMVGAPVACSEATCLPAIAGDAALLFNPADVANMANQIRLLWTDAELRRQLSNAGKKRAAAFSWDKTAHVFRAHYRRIAGRKLSETDEKLLCEPAPV